MKAMHVFYILLLFVCTLLGCSENKLEENSYLKVESTTLNFQKEKGSTTILISSNLEWSTSISQEAKNWLSIVESENSLQVIVTKNTQAESRSGIITISANSIKETITVQQLGKEASILVSPETFTVEKEGGAINVEIISNVDYDIIIPEDIDWISQKAATTNEEESTKQNFVYSIAWNAGEERKGELSVKQKDGELTKKIIIIQKKQDGYDGDSQGDIKDDIRVPVSSATASSFQNGEGIEKSFDGDMTTIYHSNWNNSAQNYFPITLEYFFEDQESIDYFIYHPRTSGYNGLLKKVEIWVTTKAEPTAKKLMDYDFTGASSTTKVLFGKTIEKPKSFKFIIQSGLGDGQGFASCAEMEFYRKNPENTDPLSIFTDLTCSELRPEMTETEIAKITNNLYRNIAYYMLEENYPSEFRIQEYRAWPDPDVWAKTNKTNTYSLLDNPTGIRVNQGDELIIFVGETGGNTLSIKIQNLDKPGGDGYGNASFYGISEGINKITAKNKGLLYLFYHTPNYESAPKIKVHIATGEVNGYFDNQKHDASDWSRLLNAAKDKYFDVLGKKAHLTFPTAAFKSYAANTGHELIAQYDDLVRLEQEFMGLMKYNRPIENRAYFHVMYHSYMYSTSYRTAYNETTLSGLLDVDVLRKNPWGPAHELGHTHQTRPGFRWHGMTEVTTNVHSLCVQTAWGNPSRLDNENLQNYGGYTNRYEKAYHQYFVKKIAHNASDDVFCKLVPFWQLQLYFGKGKGQSDFYKDFYEQIRERENPATAGDCQLNFVKLVCELTQRNLIDYFRHWGMLSPIDIEIDDYGKRQFTVTQEAIDQTITEIEAKGYEKPDAAMHYVCDSNWEVFKNQSAIQVGTATRSGKTFTMSGWKNVVAYEVWGGDKLVFASNKDSFTIDITIPVNMKVYAVAYNGTKIEVNF